jgi:hypothetical protein
MFSLIFDLFLVNPNRKLGESVQLFWRKYLDLPTKTLPRSRQNNAGIYSIVASNEVESKNILGNSVREYTY